MSSKDETYEAAKAYIPMLASFLLEFERMGFITIHREKLMSYAGMDTEKAD